MNDSPPTRHRLLLVEDHPATRAGLAACFAAEADFEVCGQTDSRHEALALVRALRPDALLLDLQLTDGTGWSLIETLAAEGQLPPTLVFSVLQEEPHAERLLRAGARGYLPKDTPLARVVPALRKMLSGHLVVSDRVATRLLGQAVGHAAAGQEARELQLLSDRELQVLQMLSQGLHNKEIAQRLGLSSKTVGTYKARLMEKLGVCTAPELQRLALQRLTNSDLAPGPGLLPGGEDVDGFEHVANMI